LQKLHLFILFWFFKRVLREILISSILLVHGNVVSLLSERNSLILFKIQTVVLSINIKWKMFYIDDFKLLKVSLAGDLPPRKLEIPRLPSRRYRRTTGESSNRSHCSDSQRFVDETEKRRKRRR
jgi:hypothetical protein